MLLKNNFSVFSSPKQKYGQTDTQTGRQRRQEGRLMMNDYGLTSHWPWFLYH